MKKTIGYTIFFLIIITSLFLLYCIWCYFLDYFNINGRYLFTIITMIISIIILAISIELNRKEKTKNYNKNIDDLISPILAETIIDGKTDIKNLIMTAIIEFNIKGNVKIIDNKKVKLLNCDNLKDYEKEIINLIFRNGNKVIDFSEINKIFMKSASETFEFSKALSSIKVKMQEYLYSLNIMSRKYTEFIEYAKSISVLIIINLPIILNVWTQVANIGLENIFIYLLFNFVLFSFFVYMFEKQTSFQQQMIDITKKNNKSFPIIIIFLFIIIVLAVTLFGILLTDDLLFVITLITIVLNIFNIIINKNNILTQYGRNQRKRLLELKNYINEYSLIKDRDLTSSFIWDEYLAYATAFGIPSKITSEIYENWYNMNITIQFIVSLF